MALALTLTLTRTVQATDVTAHHGGSDVKSPLQRWWHTALPALREARVPGRLEFRLAAGECVFLPRGWWHSVYNLEHTVALTQNFATWSSLDEVFLFLLCDLEQPG